MENIEINGSRNYSATVIRVPELRKAQNSDKLYIIDKLGMTAIVDDSWISREGELALLFPAEVQLEPGFMKANNLYRDKALNDDQTQAGYIDTNRRVRAMKLRGNISNGLVLPLTSIWFADTASLSEGNVFDTLDGYAICRKYEVPVKGGALNRGDRQVAKAFKRVDETFLPAHFDTSHWERESYRIPENAEVIVTQKLHGTSCRLGYVPVRRKPTWFETFLVKVRLAEFV